MTTMSSRARKKVKDVCWPVQVGELTLAVSRLSNEKVMLEQSMEMEEEGIVNRLQRIIESVMARNKVIPSIP